MHKKYLALPILHFSGTIQHWNRAANDGCSVSFGKLKELKPIMDFEIIEKDWCKRRVARKTLKPVAVTVSGFKLQQDHFCKMHVSYQDNSHKTLIARVIYNPLNNHWTVDGMEVSVKCVMP